MNLVQEHLKILVEMQSKHHPEFKSTYAFVLENGQEFEPIVLPEGVSRGAPKDCFGNAFRSILRHQDLVYVEGFAMGIIPVHHAWVATPEMKAIDVTWDEHLAGAEPTYFGVPFSREYVLQRACQTKIAGVLDQWREGWPLENGKHENWLWDAAPEMCR